MNSNDLMLINMSVSIQKKGFQTVMSLCESSVNYL